MVVVAHSTPHSSTPKSTGLRRGGEELYKEVGWRTTNSQKGPVAASSAVHTPSTLLILLIINGPSPVRAFGDY